MCRESKSDLMVHAKSGGCAAKFSPVCLMTIMKNNPLVSDPNLLVGMETNDDAGVYRLTEETALVQTLDFITPPCDDPFLYGQVAAANSLSDVYAMGGKPLTAMNICCFPQDGISQADLGRILEGGFSKLTEAGTLLVGGHTVKDEELKYGLSITGVVHPKNIKRNSTLKPGDKLILTKPIGAGVIVTGYKSRIIGEDVLMKAISHMIQLNKVAAELAVELGANAMTDVTGFGLACHTWWMARSSKVGVHYQFSDLPYFEESLWLIQNGVQTGVTLSNAEMVENHIIVTDEFVTRDKQMLFFDPQTSGGLLISIQPDKAQELIDRLHGAGVKEAQIVAEVFDTKEPQIVVGK